VLRSPPRPSRTSTLRCWRLPRSSPAKTGSLRTAQPDQSRLIDVWRGQMGSLPAVWRFHSSSATRVAACQTLRSLTSTCASGEGLALGPPFRILRTAFLIANAVVQNDPDQLKCGFRQLSRSLVVGHYVVGEILLRHMSSKPVSRELHGPLRRFADYTLMWMWIGPAIRPRSGIAVAKRLEHWRHWRFNDCVWRLTVVVSLHYFILGLDQIAIA
jgi:hypothetical protein